MDQAEAGEKQQTERVTQLIEQRAKLANELKAAEQAQHEAYELVKSAAEPSWLDGKNARRSPAS